MEGEDFVKSIIDKLSVLLLGLHSNFSSWESILLAHWFLVEGFLMPSVSQSASVSSTLTVPLDSNEVIAKMTDSSEPQIWRVLSRGFMHALVFLSISSRNSSLNKALSESFIWSSWMDSGWQTARIYFYKVKKKMKLLHKTIKNSLFDSS